MSIKPKERTFHPPVFFASSALILVFVVLGFLFPTQFGERATVVQDYLTTNFGWLYIVAMTGFVIFALGLAFSKFGRIKLGKDDAKPDFPTLTWLAMLFSAGMGIGLLFWSVAEPIYHFSGPPRGEAGSSEAARNAMGLTFFHWGLHPWACYAVVGLALAYFSYRKGLPLTIRSAFRPLLGDRVDGVVGDVIDTLAIVSTMFGVATSLGLGALQVNAGLNHLFGIEESSTVQILIIGVITAAATISVVTGIGKGIRRLSEGNMILAGLLLLFLLVAGPTAFLFNALVNNLGNYFQHLPRHSFWTGTFASDQGGGWLSGWTVFFWAWWIAWSPFVGMFIARISKGRTIREFIVGVIVVPCLATFVWLTVFGSSALHLQVTGQADLATAVGDVGVARLLFVMLEQYPFAMVASVAAIISVVLFFVTSSDSGSLVIDTIAAGGKTDPPKWQRVFWAVTEGAVGAVLLLAGSYAVANIADATQTVGLDALQTASITTALPFTVILILMAYSLYRSLRAETITKKVPATTRPSESLSSRKRA